MIIYGNKLAKKIRDEFDKAKSRIWIAVPFIGEWNSVKKIMGTNWIINNYLDVKVITDIGNKEFINSETIKQFLHRASVKTLTGLHAKIYIIDNSVFITSANLTGTAFSRRYEICEYFTISSSHRIITVFNDWWEKSRKVNSTWKPSKKANTNKNKSEAGNTRGLKKLWDLPQDPIKIKHFKDYQNSIIFYNHFKGLYESLNKRVFPSLPIFQEIDSFFNYLFHEHQHVPSHKYYKEPFRNISEKQRIQSIIKYFKEFEKWSKGRSESYRIKNIKLIKNKLSPNNIDNLKHIDLLDITRCFHCMNSMPINRTKFLNMKNNSIKSIKLKWKELLHDSSVDMTTRMEKSRMVGFGKSAIQELISLYFPEEYPVINSNSNSGLKLFGYDIKTY